MPAFHRFHLARAGFDPEALPAAEVSRCVAAGGTVDARDGDGWTPLPLAAARSVTPSIVTALAT